MSRSDDRRTEILNWLADFVLAEGLSSANLRPLARAAQISDRMLLYYFADKSEVIALTLGLLSKRLVAILDREAAPVPLPPDQLRARLASVVLSDEVWPYIRLWLEIAALSARGDPFYLGLGRQIGMGFLGWAAAQLDSPTEVDRNADAAALMVAMEGMIVLKAVGMDDVLQGMR